MPLVPENIEENTLIIDVVPPMELYLVLGIVNGLFGHLDKVLTENECTITATDWSTSLGMKRSQYHGGQFNGNQCKMLLGNTETLKHILHSAGAYNIGEPVLQTLEQFGKIVKSCFGRELNKDFQVQIDRFADFFLALDKSVTPKVHTVFVHVPQFLERHKNLNKGLGIGLNRLLNQYIQILIVYGFEASYKRSIFHKFYNTQLLKCVLAYNSRHR